MLGDTAPPRWTVIDPSRGHSFQLINSTFYGSDGLALQYSGDGALLQNNLFEYNDWSVTNTRSKSGGLGTVVSNGINDEFVRNTLRFNGASLDFALQDAIPLSSLTTFTISAGEFCNMMVRESSSKSVARRMLFAKTIGFTRVPSMASVLTGNPLEGDATVP